MAGDGGRVPDVSEQRAEALERGATALCRFVFPGYLVPRIEMARAVIDAYNDDREGWMDRLPPKRVLHGPLGSDPASVMAALLAESPEATVAAVEGPEGGRRCRRRCAGESNEGGNQNDERRR